MKTSNFSRFAASSFLVTFLAACSQTNAPIPTEQAPSVDPTGGTWKTVVLTSASEVTAPAPPADNSSITASEIAQIKSMQGSLTPAQKADILHWDSSAVIRWNEIARSLVIKYKTNPPMASRAYALLSIAQYDASVATWRLKYLYNRNVPSKVDPIVQTLSSVANMPSYPSDHAAIAASSAKILEYLYPTEAAWLDSVAAAHESSRIAGGYNYASDVTAGDSLGRVVSAYVLAEAASDKSNAQWAGTIPTGDSCWYSAQKPAVPPLLPAWGDVNCWLITDMTSMLAPPPPVWNSPAYLAALHEVRQISDTRTQGQIDTALQWADGAGTYTPPGHWNLLASQAMIGRGWSTLRQARTMALMNMAMMDAGVCCWKTKYICWLIRPSEADTNIKLAVPLPNFPSYTSGHSSFSSAAAEVLGYLMPDRKDEFTGWAHAAAISRVYGGIHYRFDSDAGFAMGTKVGDLAIARGEADGSN